MLFQKPLRFVHCTPDCVQGRISKWPFHTIDKGLLLENSTYLEFFKLPYVFKIHFDWQIAYHQLIHQKIQFCSNGGCDAQQNSVCTLWCSTSWTQGFLHQISLNPTQYTFKILIPVDNGFIIGFDWKFSVQVYSYEPNLAQGVSKDKQNWLVWP